MPIYDPTLSKLEKKTVTHHVHDLNSLKHETQSPNAEQKADSG